LSGNLQTLLTGVVDALRSRDPASVERLLDPELVWEGAMPGARCSGRQEAMHLIAPRLAGGLPAPRAVEVIDAGDRIVVGLQGPGWNGIPGDLATDGRVYTVVTFARGKVVRLQGFSDRAEALAAAGAYPVAWR
jgi:hypothetical protein